jgi:hypothetical protein
VNQVDQVDLEVAMVVVLMDFHHPCARQPPYTRGLRGCCVSSGWNLVAELGAKLLLYLQ